MTGTFDSNPTVGDITAEDALESRARVVAAAHLGGELRPDEIIGGDDILTFIESLPHNQQKRAEKALATPIRVFPDVRGMYRAYSSKETEATAVDQKTGLVDSEDDRFYNVDIFRTSRCLCGDFLFRCDHDRGEQCKHLWRVRLLANLGGIPDREENPYWWLPDELDADARLAWGVGQRRVASNLASLSEWVRESERKWIVSEKVCTRRANLLCEAANLDVA